MSIPAFPAAYACPGALNKAWHRIGMCSIRLVGTDVPSIRGVWSADPDLSILAVHLKTRLGIAPLVEYRHLAIVAHSMGGLVVQRAMLDNPALVARVSSAALRDAEQRTA